MSEPDTSWLVVAIAADRVGVDYTTGFVLDAAKGFYDLCILDGEEIGPNGIEPPENVKPGLYKIEEAKYDIDYDPETGSVDEVLIWGKWTPLHTLNTA